MKRRRRRRREKKTQIRVDRANGENRTISKPIETIVKKQIEEKEKKKIIIIR
jgi:hypothetical protein